MASYTVVHQLISGAPQAVSLAPAPRPLVGVTTGTTTSQYFTRGQIVLDTLVGDANAINRLLALGAIR